MPNQAVFLRTLGFSPGLQGLRFLASSTAFLVFLITDFHCIGGGAKVSSMDRQSETRHDS